MGINWERDICKINEDYLLPLDLEIARYISYDKLEDMFSSP